jgi:hypothetical protein
MGGFIKSAVSAFTGSNGAGGIFGAVSSLFKGDIGGFLRQAVPMAVSALAPGVSSAISAFASSPLGGFVSKLFPEASSTIQSLVGGGTSSTTATGKNWWDSISNAIKA